MSGSWKALGGALVLFAACGPADGYVMSHGGNAGSDEDGEGLHPAPPPGPSATDLCSEFLEGLGDDVIDAQVQAELVEDSIYLSVWRTEEPIPACVGICHDSWVFSMFLPLPLRDSFDLAANEVLADFTQSSEKAGQCGCIAGAGLAAGSVDIVAMDSEAICGWMVEDQLFHVSGGFSATVISP